MLVTVARRLAPRYASAAGARCSGAGARAGATHGAVALRQATRRFAQGLPRVANTAARRPLPTLSKRSFFALPQGDALPVLGGLIGANCLVYGAWQIADPRLMTRHFTLSNDDVLQYPHTLVTSFFSHASGWHLLGNMVTLFFFAPEAIGALGAARFLTVFGGAGLAANAAQLGANAYANARRDPYFRQRSPRCLGASGAVNAAVAYGCLMNPWRLIIVFAEFLPLPLPALLYGGAFLAKDVGALLDVDIPYVTDRARGIAHGAHVGGTLVLFSVPYFFLRETMTIIHLTLSERAAEENGFLQSLPTSFRVSPSFRASRRPAPGACSSFRSQVGVGAFFVMARRGQFRRWK